MLTFGPNKKTLYLSAFKTFNDSINEIMLSSKLCKHFMRSLYKYFAILIYNLKYVQIQ